LISELINFEFRFVGLSPLRREGALPEILSGPEGQRGGLEIVFNQQLTRLGITSLAASLPQAQRWFEMLAHPFLLYPPPLRTQALANRGETKTQPGNAKPPNGVDRSNFRRPLLPRASAPRHARALLSDYELGGTEVSPESCADGIYCTGEGPGRPRHYMARGRQAAYYPGNCVLTLGSKKSSTR
jgi:hypothetical protein